MGVQRDAERLIQRRQEVAGGDRPLADLAAARLAGPDHLAALQPAAAQQHRKAVGPVVAAGVAVDQRRAAELARAVNDHVVEHPAFFEVFHQRRDRRVERRQVLLQVLSRCRRGGPSSPC